MGRLFNRVKQYCIVVLSITCVSCVDEEIKIVGKYKSVEPSLLEKALKYRRWATGSELLLSKDSAFVMTTCGMISKGKWYVIHDSLYLKDESRRFRIDSFNHIKPWNESLVIKENDIGRYKIDGEHLEQTFRFKNGKVGLGRLRKN